MRPPNRPWSLQRNGYLSEAREGIFLGFCGCWGSFARVGTREAKEEHRKSQRKEVMSRNKGRHKQEKRRRHERQIAEGTRIPRERIRKPLMLTTPRRRALLSEVNAEDVRKILEIVKNLQLY